MSIKGKKIQVRYNVGDSSEQKLFIDGVDVSNIVRNIYVKLGVDEEPRVTVDFIAEHIDLDLLGIEIEAK